MNTCLTNCDYRTMRRAFVVMLFTGVALALDIGSASAARPLYTVRLLPDTPGELTDVNNNGDVVGWGDYDGTYYAYILRSSGTTFIPLPDGWDRARAYGINDSGQVAGYLERNVNGDLQWRAFIATESSFSLIPLPDGLDFSAASDINNAGQVVGWEPVGGAFIGTTAGVSYVAAPSGWHAPTAWAINELGQVTGAAYGPDGLSYAYIGSASSFTPVPRPSIAYPDDLLYGAGINNHGQIAGIMEGAWGYKAFVGTAEEAVAIPMLPDARLDPVQNHRDVAINDSGQLVGESRYYDPFHQPPDWWGTWIWDQSHGTRALQSLVPPQWRFFEPRAINQNGQILVTYAKNLNTGETGSALLEPVPEAEAELAYFSLQGSFEAFDGIQLFQFRLDDPIASTDPRLGSRTYHNSGSSNAPGGTNVAGDVIAAGGFDPILKLLDAPGAELGVNDDGFGSWNYDSYLSWPGIAASGGAITVDPLPAGEYRLELSAVASHFAGRDPDWAVDLVGPANGMTLVGVPGLLSGVSSLKFGTDCSSLCLPMGNAVVRLVPGDVLSLEEMVVRGNPSVVGGAGATLDLDGAVLNVTYLQNEGDVIVRSGSAIRTDQLTNHGLIRVSDGNLAVVGNVVNARLVNLTGGGLAVVGDYTHYSGSTLRIEIEGLEKGLDYGVLAVTGDAAFSGGILKLAFPEEEGDYIPAAGDTFDLLDLVSSLGQFDAVTTSGILGDLVLNTSRLYVDGTVVLALPGDFDQDGDVDGADLALWQGDYGLNANCDADGDGDTDGRDFLVWQRQYTGELAPTVNLSIPEPASLCLMLMALAGSVLASRNTF